MLILKLFITQLNKQKTAYLLKFRIIFNEMK
ncbi:hypothetical protein EV196_105117 [Mariniflexile fucanivorans]|uniref:Uncharacterized protein n=1 Tax=Mariniflexile fucanivorans TaxID=264023 RepID=A0A4R1RHP7_9FLAO|nr:hypothetical protein EV196_105117 [Mariniflexile fucanivorans]